MSTSDRDEWPARLARGDEDAFAELCDACADRLHHYLAVRLGCRESASDVLQSAFLRAVLLTTLATALDAERDRETFFEQVERGVAERLALDPVEMRIPLVRLVVEKQAATR